MKERKKLTKVTARKYRAAKKREKTKIPDIFIGQTGYGRKYAIHILANEGRIKYAGKKIKLKTARGSGRKRVYPRYYDNAVKDAPALVWEAFSRQCGKLLAPFLHANMDNIAEDPGFNIGGDVVVKLKKTSAAAVDRLLKKDKAAFKIKGANGTKPAPGHMKKLIPVPARFERVDRGSGLWQTDLVQHDGGCPSGEFCYTLTVTEIKHAWTVRYALKNKAFTWVHRAPDDAYSKLPIPIRVPHSDNGGEFINRAVALWCGQKGIIQTRSRSGKKNGNCFVEQKNGASVRKIVGYARYSGDRGAAALQAVYGRYDKLPNCFYPCQKLVSKERVGSKVKKKYDKPMPPYDRVISDKEIPGEYKKRLRSFKKRISLMAEMERMRRAVDRLASFAEPVPVLVIKQNMKPLSFGSYGLNS